MPLNYRGRLCKKLRQSNHAIRQAQTYMIQVEKALEPYHKDRAYILHDLVQALDVLSHNLTCYSVQTFTYGEFPRYTVETLRAMYRRLREPPHYD